MGVRRIRQAGLRAVLALALACGALAFGCESSGPAAPADANPTVDAKPADDANPADDATGDAMSGDAPTDAPADVPVDNPAFDGGPPADVGPLDASPVDSGPAVIRGHAATALVSAGAWMTSPGHRMLSTLGQSSIHQSVLRSPRYLLRGGLVGATGGTR